MGGSKVAPSGPKSVAYPTTLIPVSGRGGSGVSASGTTVITSTGAPSAVSDTVSAAISSTISLFAVAITTSSWTTP